MKLPRLRMRKTTRSILSGLAIAVASLFALARAYEEARANLMNFFVGIILILLLVLALAAILAGLWTGLRALIGLLTRPRNK